MASTDVGVRRSVRCLQEEYDNGNKKPLEDLVRAWRGIKALPPSDKRSFFVLGGYHGEPFQYRRQVDDLSTTDRYLYWGGYCNHGNVLFPTWHRVYVLKLEEALQSIVPGVRMPFWDQTSEESLAEGIPRVLTDETFELDGETIPNPLRSFVLPLELSDDAPADNKVWEKPKGYETVRYPLSGLVGTPQAQAETNAHNSKFKDPAENVRLLNENFKAWLKGPTPSEPTPSPHGILWRYKKCLEAPNYTVFSNTTSANQWNLDRPGKVTPLEDPHNDVHLAVGGFDVPGQGEAGVIAGANGDMGENNTAAMDPIFFFHHCNVDRMFWLWQKRHGKTDDLDIIDGFAGTDSSDSQGPTPGIPPGSALGLDTPLNPFLKDEFGTVFTSRDCVNIEKQLGYSYGPGSLDDAGEATVQGGRGKKLAVRGIDRALFQGSFVIRASARTKDEDGKTTEHNLGHHAVLSRRNVVMCANCLTHLEAVAQFPLDGVPDDALDDATFHIEIQHRGAQLPEGLSYTLTVLD